MIGSDHTNFPASQGTTVADYIDSVQVMFQALHAYIGIQTWLVYVYLLLQSNVYTEICCLLFHE